MNTPPSSVIVRVSWRQYDVVQQLAFDGADNETIGRRLGLSTETVRSHLQAAYRRTGFNSRTALALAVDRGEIILRAGGSGSRGRDTLAA